MKTAISLPDELVDAADELADKLGISRSLLYARALSDYVAHHSNSQRDVTDRLNRVYGDVDSQLDPVLEELQFRTIASAGDEW